MSNKNVAKVLHNVLSNSYALALKTQNYHWNVVGANFKSLHELFGAQYEELSEAIDEIAERIRALDILVPASFDVFGKESKIKNGNENAKTLAMVKELYNDNQTLTKILYDALKIVQKEGDEGTADMLIGRIQAHDKNAWMLKSSL
ncbi:MAG: Dps family protein [Pseudomonadota bacterium]